MSNTSIATPTPTQIQKFVKGAIANGVKAVPTVQQQHALAKLQAARSKPQGRIDPKLQARIDCLEPLVQQAAKDLLRGVWLVQAKSALSAATLPQDPISGGYAVLALAGNLIWAASSLCPEFKAAVVLLSFAGAIPGSGVFTPVPSVKDGKEKINEALNQAADVAEKKIFAFSKHAAALLIGLMPVYDKLPSDARDRLGFIEAFVFYAMFPGLPYERKHTAISSVSSAKITRALVEFDKQYKAWAKKAVLWKMKTGTKYGTLPMGDLMTGECLDEYAKAVEMFKPDINGALTTANAPLQ
ncbi:MAG: hypothetical protein LAQ69_07640 [Acidobacteriia bacterium]|nr:hypothetical protein [Terriglobia bacterium]